MRPVCEVCLNKQLGKADPDFSWDTKAQELLGTQRKNPVSWSSPFCLMWSSLSEDALKKRIHISFFFFFPGGFTGGVAPQKRHPD